jgi:hypothetical protein
MHRLKPGILIVGYLSLACAPPEVAPFTGQEAITQYGSEFRDSSSCGDSNYAGDGLSFHTNSGAHVCAPGYGMTGAHLATNSFICQAQGYASSTCNWQNGSKSFCGDNSVCGSGGAGKCADGANCHTMLSCLDGYFMAGYNGGANQVYCCTTHSSAGYNDEHGATGSGTSRNFNVGSSCASTAVHMCTIVAGSGWFMQGIHAGNNIFGCTR